MMSSVILGAFLGGGIIALFGVAAGFWVIAVSSALAAIQYGRTPLPSAPPAAGGHRKGAVREGLRVGLGTEPLRSLLGLTFVIGMATTAVMLLLPAVARDVLQVGAFGAGLLNAAMGVGMMVISLVVAARPAPGRPGLCWSCSSVAPSAPGWSCWAGRAATRCRWPSSSGGAPSAG